MAEADSSGVLDVEVPVWDFWVSWSCIFRRGGRQLEWSVINGDTRFVLNLFQYDADPDSPNVC